VKKMMKAKCVVWDLDNTVWEGTLLEDPNVYLKKGVVEIIQKLDERGILQSIASKNDHATAMNKLKEFGLDEYFIYPQIHWNAKSSSIRQIAGSINIGIDTLAFVDDQPFEREEVKYAHPEVLCIDGTQLDEMLDMPELQPRFITEDSKKRRQMYMSDIVRNQAEGEYEGAQECFLESLNMEFAISEVSEGDLQRAEELTVRTNQLNATGYTYSFEELNAFRKSDRHKLLIAELNDKYGTYGKIGLVLLECQEEVWTLKLLLVSCRVMSRGVGTIMLNYVMNMAKQANARLLAEFVPTDKNRIMYITYKFVGFQELQQTDKLIVFEHELSNDFAYPNYVRMKVLA
jgi:FkbH-like protein